VICTASQHAAALYDRRQSPKTPHPISDGSRIQNTKTSRVVYGRFEGSAKSIGGAGSWYAGDANVT
jgi:hypothetical protein